MTARRELREGGARGARQARVSLCVGARGWQHEFGRQWFCAPNCASAALFSAQSFAVGCGGHRCTAEQVARLLVAIATRLRTIFRCDVTADSASSVGSFAVSNERSDPSQPSGAAPHRLPSTLRATGREPPHFGPSPTKNDPDPSEQPLRHYKAALRGRGPRDGLALRWSAATT